MKGNKKFDAVRMMREIRDRLSKKYSKDPVAQVRDLQRIRMQHRMRVKKQEANV